MKFLENSSVSGRVKAVLKDIFRGIWQRLNNVYIRINLRFRQRRLEKVMTPGCVWRRHLHPIRRMEIIKADLEWFNKDRVAVTLGSMKYNEFLKTPYWKAVADYVNWRDRKRCRKCGKKASWLEAHHTTYDIRGYEIYNTAAIISLCNACHHS